MKVCKKEKREVPGWFELMTLEGIFACQRLYHWAIVHLLS